MSGQLQHLSTQNKNVNASATPDSHQSLLPMAAKAFSFLLRDQLIADQRTVLQGLNFYVDSSIPDSTRRQIVGTINSLKGRNSFSFNPRSTHFVIVQPDFFKRLNGYTLSNSELITPWLLKAIKQVQRNVVLNAQRSGVTPKFSHCMAEAAKILNQSQTNLKAGNAVDQTRNYNNFSQNQQQQINGQLNSFNNKSCSEQDFGKLLDVKDLQYCLDFIESHSTKWHNARLKQVRLEKDQIKPSYQSGYNDQGYFVISKINATNKQQSSSSRVSQHDFVQIFHELEKKDNQNNQDSQKQDQQPQQQSRKGGSLLDTCHNMLGLSLKNGQQSQVKAVVGEYDCYKLDMKMPIGMCVCATAAEKKFGQEHFHKIEKYKRKENIKELANFQSQTEGIHHPDKSEIEEPKPQSNHSYCQICNEQFENYLEHIQDKNHKVRASLQTSAFNEIQQIFDILNDEKPWVHRWKEQAPVVEKFKSEAKKAVVQKEKVKEEQSKKELVQSSNKINEQKNQAQEVQSNDQAAVLLQNKDMPMLETKDVDQPMLVDEKDQQQEVVLEDSKKQTQDNGEKLLKSQEDPDKDNDSIIEKMYNHNNQEEMEELDRSVTPITANQQLIIPQTPTKNAMISPLKKQDCFLQIEPLENQLKKPSTKKQTPGKPLLFHNTLNNELNDLEEDQDDMIVDIKESVAAKTENANLFFLTDKSKSAHSNNLTAAVLQQQTNHKDNISSGYFKDIQGDEEENQDGCSEQKDKEMVETVYFTCQGGVDKGSQQSRGSQQVEEGQVHDQDEAHNEEQDVEKMDSSGSEHQEMLSVEEQDDEDESTYKIQCNFAQSNQGQVNNFLQIPKVKDSMLDKLFNNNNVVDNKQEVIAIDSSHHDNHQYMSQQPEEELIDYVENDTIHIVDLKESQENEPVNTKITIPLQASTQEADNMQNQSQPQQSQSLLISSQQNTDQLCELNEQNNKDQDLLNNAADSQNTQKTNLDINVDLLPQQSLGDLCQQPVTPILNNDASQTKRKMESLHDRISQLKERNRRSQSEGRCVMNFCTSSVSNSVIKNKAQEPQNNFQIEDTTGKINKNTFSAEESNGNIENCQNQLNIKQRKKDLSGDEQIKKDTVLNSLCQKLDFDSQRENGIYSKPKESYQQYQQKLFQPSVTTSTNFYKQRVSLSNNNMSDGLKDLKQIQQSLDNVTQNLLSKSGTLDNQETCDLLKTSQTTGTTWVRPKATPYLPKKSQPQAPQHSAFNTSGCTTTVSNTKQQSQESMDKSQQHQLLKNNTDLNVNSTRNEHNNKAQLFEQKTTSVKKSQADSQMSSQKFQGQYQSYLRQRGMSVSRTNQILSKSTNPFGQRAGGNQNISTNHNQINCGASQKSNQQYSSNANGHNWNHNQSNNQQGYQNSSMRQSNNHLYTQTTATTAATKHTMYSTQSNRNPSKPHNYQSSSNQFVHKLNNYNRFGGSRSFLVNKSSMGSTAQGSFAQQSQSKKRTYDQYQRQPHNQQYQQSMQQHGAGGMHSNQLSKKRKLF